MKTHKFKIGDPVRLTYGNRGVHYIEEIIWPVNSSFARYKLSGMPHVFVNPMGIEPLSILEQLAIELKD